MDTMREKSPKLKQRKIIGLGELYESFITALPVLSAIQFMSILAVLYNQLQPTLVGVFPGITLIKFLVILGLIMLGVMILVYKFLIPSVWTFRGKQLYGFESELMDEVKKLRAEFGLTDEERAWIGNCLQDKIIRLLKLNDYKWGTTTETLLSICNNRIQGQLTKEYLEGIAREEEPNE